MTNEHPITPPPELVQQWGHDANLAGAPWNGENWAYELFIAACAAQWGADQELETCRQWLEINGAPREFIDGLRAARRPKPPSLKEQAMAKTTAILNDPSRAFSIEVRETLELNLRALEALPDD